MSRSRNKELVKEHYTFGQKAYKEGRYEEAWKNFDKAISFGGKTLLLLDSKAAAMSKLPEWRRHAFEITKDMIQKFPNDWQGHYRQAKVFQYLGALDKALDAANAAVRFSPKRTENEKTFRAIQSLRADLIIDKDKADRLRAQNDEAEKARQKAARRAAMKAKINYTHLLSPDVLVIICEHGMQDLPNFVFRMASVCRAWRGVLLSHGSLWNRLVLRKKKVAEKAKLYMERTNGRLKEIKFAEDFDNSHAAEVATVLLPCLGALQRLEFQTTPAFISKHWQGRLENLTHLRFCREPVGVTKNDLVHGLLSPTCTSLRELESEEGVLWHFFDEKELLTAEDPLRNLRVNPTYHSPYDPDTAPDYPFWTENPQAHLSRIKKLTLRQKLIYTEWMNLSELLRHFPSAESIALDATDLHRVLNPDNLSGWYQWRSQRDSHTILPELRAFSHTNVQNAFVFNEIHAPNLLHYDIWNSSVRGVASCMPLILAPGLEFARPHLLSLDIGRCPVDQEQLLEVLTKLPSLQFLNVSFCSLNNGFLEALERTGDSKDLLPRLTALSIAGNEELTSGPLRHFVHSRLPQRSRSSSSQSASQSKRGSAFRPSAPKSSPFGPTKPPAKAKRSESTPVSHPNESHVLSQPAAVSTPTILLTTSEPARPSIRWLCIDNCERIEIEASDQLRTKVRFMSHAFSVIPVEQRIRGKGKYAWDADYTADCGPGAGGCGLRKLPGTKDGWYVHHRCEPKDLEKVEPGWTQSSSQIESLEEERS